MNDAVVHGLERKKPSARHRRTASAASALDVTAIQLDDRALYISIYEQLRQSIIQGALRPGETLSTRTLASRLGVSTSPVRDALRRLVADGVVQALPKSAFSVPPISAERYAELLEIRVVLEGFAVRCATPNISQEISKLARLNDIYTNLNVTGDQLLRMNQEFHFTIYRASGMQDLVRLIETLWVRVGPFLNLSIAEEARKAAHGFHQRIIDALKSGDATAAAEALEADLRGAARIIIASL